MKYGFYFVYLTLLQEVHQFHISKNHLTILTVQKSDISNLHDLQQAESPHLRQHKTRIPAPAPQYLRAEPAKKSRYNYWRGFGSDGVAGLYDFVRK